MRMDILKKGDKVLSVTNKLIAIQRENGEVEVIRFLIDKEGVWIADEETLIIGYADNAEESEIIDGVVITNF